MPSLGFQVLTTVLIHPFIQEIRPTAAPSKMPTLAGKTIGPIGFGLMGNQFHIPGSIFTDSKLRQDSPGVQIPLLTNKLSKP